MDDDQIFEDLILSGALEFAGLDIDSGEMLYNFTEKLKDVNPALHDEFSTYLYSEVSELWANGFLDMYFTEENPRVTLTAKALDPEEVAKLDKTKQYTLKEIVRIIMKDGKEGA
jgi:hypothetical protein